MRDDQTTLAELRKLVAEFVAERDWQSYHDAKNLSMAIAIEAAELMEHFQWIRSEEVDEHLNAANVSSEIRDELADIVCFVLGLANRLKIDLAEAVEQKMTKNRLKYPPERFRGRYFKPGDTR